MGDSSHGTPKLLNIGAPYARDERCCAESDEEVATLSTMNIISLRFPLPLLEELSNKGRIESRDKMRFELAFQEALTNAVEHGNLELKSEWRESINEDGVDLYSQVKNARLANPKFAERRIQIGVRCDNTRLMVRIANEGPGFAPEPPPASTNSDLDCHGRGMALIYAATDEVFFNENGTEITLVKQLR